MGGEHVEAAARARRHPATFLFGLVALMVAGAVLAMPFTDQEGARCDGAMFSINDASVDVQRTVATLPPADPRTTLPGGLREVGGTVEETTTTRTPTSCARTAERRFALPLALAGLAAAVVAVDGERVATARRPRPTGERERRDGESALLRQVRGAGVWAAIGVWVATLSGPLHALVIGIVAICIGLLRGLELDPASLDELIDGPRHGRRHEWTLTLLHMMAAPLSWFAVGYLLGGAPEAL